MQMLRTVQRRIDEMEDRGETDEGFLQVEGDGGAFVDEEESRAEQQDEEEVEEEVVEQGGSSSEAADSDDPI